MALPQIFKDLRFQLFYALLQRSHCKLTTLGEACAWTFCSDDLGPSSRILSAGAGNDISFEAKLIEHFGCAVVLLDPSPTGAATIRKSPGLEKSLSFLPVGLAAQDGQVQFANPSDPQEGSYRRAAEKSGEAWTFRCRSLPSLMDELNWQELDLLKIDIEGFEYEVVDQLVDRRLKVHQLCVEFHHGPAFGFSRYDTIRRILALWKAGYDLVHRVNWDHTFVLRADRKRRAGLNATSK